MARNRKRKTDRETVGADKMEQAVDEVVRKNRSVKSVAVEFHIKRTMLRRYIFKYKSAQNKDQVRYVPKYNARQIFSEDQEAMLAEYLLTAAKHNYGHSATMARRLAYEFATQNDVNVPEAWLRDCSAGEEWLVGFLKRHQSLSIRTPEATSLSRSTAFNRHNVAKFFGNLNLVYSRQQYGPDAVYNCDETGLTTVQKPPRVIAGKGMKQVASVTSQERGQLVTACCTVNATGNSIPPFLIFPRVYFKQHMLFGAPPGSQGTAYPSGWMTSDTFVRYLKHFIHYSRCSTEKQVLLLLDNHESHINIEVINLCKENGITLLTFPPHTSHKLQPLDVAVYGPLKSYYNSACTGWLHANPGTPMTILNVAECFGKAYQLAFTPKNVQAGFKAAGIWPMNRDLFHDGDFDCAFVSDRPQPQPAEDCQQSRSDAPDKAVADDQPEAGSSSLSDHSYVQQPVDTFADDPQQRSPNESVNNQPTATATQNNADQPGCESNLLPTMTPVQKTQNTPKKTTCVTPEEVRPFPKARARKTSRSASNRRRGDTQILTDTPVKRKIEEKATFSANKRRKKEVGKDKKVVQKKEMQKKVKSVCVRKTKKKLKFAEQHDKGKNDASCNEKCKICSVTYGDKGDIRSAEDWLQCAGCQLWFHESCAQANGVLDDDDTYTCIQCVG